MSRPKKCRRICREPSFDAFVPVGIPSEGTIMLSVDEYEAVRLIDFEKRTQEECAAQMNVARTTITDMYNQARFKIADAMVNGKRLIIDGGNYTVCGRKAACGGLGQCFFAGKSAGVSTGHTDQEINRDLTQLSSMKEKRSNQMRIAVTYDNGEVFQHFGHTEAFKIYDVEDGKVVAEQVLETNGQGHGALAGFLLSGQVDVLICGGIGGGAQMALADAGIKLYGGVTGSADAAVQAFLAGKLGYNPDVKCDHHDHEHGGEEHHCGEHGCGNHGCH